MISITVSDMRSRSKPGFVAKILDNGDRSFLSASEYSNHGTSHKKITFNIDEDGIYEVQDANFGSTRINRYYIWIKGGEIVEEDEQLANLLVADIDLPDLQGTPAQVVWAKDIRSKYIAKKRQEGYRVNSRILEETSAKFFINNREKLK